MSAPIALDEAVGLLLLDLEAAETTEGYRGRLTQSICSYAAFVGEPSPTLAILEANTFRRFTLDLREPRAGKRRAVKTVRNIAACVKRLSAWAYDHEMLERDPLDRVRLPKIKPPVMPVLSPAQAGRLIAAAASSKNGLRDRALTLFLLGSGARVSEACSVRWGDLDLERGRATVLGKGDKQRVLRFDAAVRQALVDLRDSGQPGQPGRSDRCFQTHSRQTVLKILYRLSDRAGIPRTSPHTLRRTFATSFSQAHPEALFVLQELLGHTDLTMTRRYARRGSVEADLPGPGPLEILNVHEGERLAASEVKSAWALPTRQALAQDEGLVADIHGRLSMGQPIEQIAAETHHTKDSIYAVLRERPHPIIRDAIALPEAAQRMGITLDALQKRITAGRGAPPAVRLGGRWYVHLDGWGAAAMAR